MIVSFIRRAGRSTAAGIAASLFMAAAASAHNEGFRMLYTAEMTGDQVVPKVTTEAKGVVGIILNGHGDSVAIYGAATRLSGKITSLALYAGEPGANGNVFRDMPLAIKGNTFSGNLAVSAGEIGKFMRGAYYIVASTAANPNGEIRGQLTMARNRQYIVELKGDNAVPKATTPATGFGVFYLSPDDSVLTIRAVFGGLKDSVTSVHFGYGKADDADAVDLDLTSKVSGGILSASIRPPAEAHGALAKGAKAAHVEFAEFLEKGEVFFTVATKAHTAGEIRGQLQETQERIFISEMTGGKNVPVAATSALGLSLFQLSADDSTLNVYAAYTGLDSVAAIHLHRGSKTANSDTLPTEPQANWASSLTGSYLKAVQKVSALSPAAFLKDLARGNVYTNVHTKAFPTGAIRGSLLVPFRIGTIAPLEGAQEVPAVSAKAFGVALVTMDPDSGNVAYSIVADSLSSAFTSIHIQKQGAGSAGASVLDITSSFTSKPDSMTGLIASGTWWSTQPASPFTKVLAKAFAAESLYVNINTRTNANGEIRGQIKDRVPELRAVPALPSARRFPESRLIFGAGARELRLQAQPGRILMLTVTDVQGRSAFRARLLVGRDGFSRNVDLAALRPGVYAAAWGDGSSRRTARFLRH